MKVTFVYGDDWDGVYFDGWLKAEGHSLDPERVVRLILESDRILTEVDRISITPEYMAKMQYEGSSLPRGLFELKRLMAA